MDAVRRGDRLWVPEGAIRSRLARNKRLSSADCVSTAEVAAFFGVDPKTVRDWYGRGLLRAKEKIHNRLCFEVATVAQFQPPTTKSPRGRYPKRTPTRTLNGVYYPTPPRKGEPSDGEDRNGEAH